MIYQVYRKMMRKFARFILGFENCPADCRKSFKEGFELATDAFLLCAITVALFLVLAINC